MNKIMVALAIYASGCVPVGGCPDSGPAIVADAGADVDASGPTPGTIGSVDACRLLEYAAVDDGLDPAVCPVDCPWQAIGGPGNPVEECDPAGVIACVQHVANTNDCAHLAGALAMCDANACVVVTP